MGRHTSGLGGRGGGRGGEVCEAGSAVKTQAGRSLCLSSGRSFRLERGGCRGPRGASARAMGPKPFRYATGPAGRRAFHRDAQPSPPGPSRSRRAKIASSSQSRRVCCDFKALNRAPGMLSGPPRSRGQFCPAADRHGLRWRGGLRGRWRDQNPGAGGSRTNGREGRRGGMEKGGGLSKLPNKNDLVPAPAHLFLPHCGTRPLARHPQLRPALRAALHDRSPPHPPHPPPLPACRARSRRTR